MISLDGTSWFRPDEEFWRAQGGPAADQIISTVGDDWVQLPEGDESFASFCDLDGLLEQIEDDEDQKPSEKGETEDVDGQEAIKLTRDNAKEGGGTTTVWVAVDDPHHILKVEREGGEAPSSVSFSEFGDDVHCCGRRRGQTRAASSSAKPPPHRIDRALPPRRRGQITVEELATQQQRTPSGRCG